MTPSEARARYRAGLAVPTIGECAGHTQANLLAVPADWAYDVLLFTQRNPKPCPVLDVTDPGSTSTALAPTADLRTDLPRVWLHGRPVAEPSDVIDVWRDDLVTFLIGCSFTFERALAEAGVPLRHVAQGHNVPMYVTSQACRAGGRLSGPFVVSMRPVPAGLVSTAVRITAGLPLAHGEPVHVGHPASLGVADLNVPDFGDPVEAEPGDVPVFWACGVTTHLALSASGAPFAITHAPGHMLVTDVPDVAFRAFSTRGQVPRIGAVGRQSGAVVVTAIGEDAGEPACTTASRPRSPAPRRPLGDPAPPAPVELVPSGVRSTPPSR